MMVLAFLVMDGTGLYLRRLHGDLGIGWFQRVLVLIAIGSQACLATSFHYAYMSIFAVGTGLSSPQVCLRMFFFFFG